jgi:cytochrome c-type biogenesis protein CcsB
MLESSSYALSFVLPILYGLTTVAYLVHFVRNRDVRSTTSMVFLIVTIVVHMAAVLIRLVGERHVPLANVGEAVSFFALCTALVYAYLEIRMRKQSLGIFILAIVLLFQTVATFRWEGFAPIAESLKSPWFAVHVTGTIFAFSGFAIATVSSVLYLMLYRELHSARPGFIFQRIPPLDALDDMSRRAIKLGFILLTFGILTGMMWAKGAWGFFWRWDPKMCTSLTVWLIYASYMWARTRQSWNGRRVAYIALLGFAMLIFTFVIVDVLFHTEHRFV